MADQEVNSRAIASGLTCHLARRSDDRHLESPAWSQASPTALIVEPKERGGRRAGADLEHGLPDPCAAGGVRRRTSERRGRATRYRDPPGNAMSATLASRARIWDGTRALTSSVVNHNALDFPARLADALGLEPPTPGPHAIALLDRDPAPALFAALSEAEAVGGTVMCDSAQPLTRVIAAAYAAFAGFGP